VRSDVRANRERLVKAASHLRSRAGTNGVSMGDVADLAGMSQATAYRHFSSVDAVLQEFRRSVGAKLLNFTDAQTLSGVALLDAVSRQWIQLVLAHGQAMIQTRSSEGYLRRLRNRPSYLSDQALALQRPLTQACTELGLPEPGDEGMFLWNIFFDPREITDLGSAGGMSETMVGDLLVATFLGALRGWFASNVPYPARPDPKRARFH
jgi:AcrR family transcriptional regulator